MLYIQMVSFIKNEGHKNIKCILYYNHIFCFSCGLQFAKDVNWHQLVGLYAKHIINNLEVVDENELRHGDGGHNVNGDNVVQCTGFRTCNSDANGVQIGNNVDRDPNLSGNNVDVEENL